MGSIPTGRLHYFSFRQDPPDDAIMKLEIGFLLSNLGDHAETIVGIGKRKYVANVST